MKKLGFTLAEVLITLVIIGVIAAMTVPTLMNNTNAQEYRSAFKKAISATNQALTLQYALEGVSAADVDGASGLVTDVFKRRMSTIDGVTSWPAATSGGGTCGGASANTMFTTADGMIYCVTDAFSAGTGDNSTVCDVYNEHPCSSGAYNLIIDVNGAKKPNQLTTSSNRPRDQYTAMIYAQKVIPYGQAAQEVMFDRGTSNSASGNATAGQGGSTTGSNTTGG